jgi:hypothetical protein
MTKLNLANAAWHKSSRSGKGSSGTCVEVALVSTHVVIRDSQNPNKGNLVLPSNQWQNFIQGVRHGKFDL